MPFAKDSTIEAPPDVVLAVMTSDAFFAAYAAVVEARSYAAEVAEDGDSRTVTFQYSVPTDELPSLFRAFVGHEVPITDRRAWRSDGNSGLVSKLNVRAQALGKDATISGSLALEAVGDGTRYSVKGAAHVPLPFFVRGAATSGVEDLAGELFDDEVKLIKSHLLDGVPG